MSKRTKAISLFSHGCVLLHRQASSFSSLIQDDNDDDDNDNDDHDEDHDDNDDQNNEDLDMSMLRHMIIVAFACLCCCVGIRGFVAIKSGFCEIVALDGFKK